MVNNKNQKEIWKGPTAVFFFLLFLFLFLKKSFAQIVLPISTHFILESWRSRATMCRVQSKKSS